MKRVLIAVVVLSAGLCGLIGWKLHAQAAALRGPSGGSGVIEGTDVNVASRVVARIVTASVRRGDQVHRGQVLFALDCAEPQLALAEGEARAAAAEAQVAAAEAAEAAAEQAQAATRAQASASRAQASALAVQRDAAARNARRTEALGSAATDANRDQSRTAVDGLAYQVRAAEASGVALARQSQAASAQQRAAHAQVEAARRSASAAATAVARARIAVGECEVRAPRDATVDQVYYEAGELPPPGAVLARLVDLREVRATFYLPNGELGRARPGATAVVVADAYPDERFAGTLVTVAAEAEFTPRNIQTRTDRDRLVYAVEVRVPNPAARLRPGMPVQVTLPGTAR